MRPVLLAALFAFAALPASAQELGKSIMVGDWLVRRVAGEGTVQSCVAFREGDDKSGVGFGGTNTMQGFLMLLDPKGKFKPQIEYALEYKVDSKKTAKAKALAVNGQMLVLQLGTLGDVSPFFTAVEEGNDIHLETDDSTYDYSLAGSKAALAALESCLKAAMQ